MATDQALLDRSEATGEGHLRFYCWSPHCLSFGRNEPAALRYDRETIATSSIDTVRRPTGGRGVWHARELTYAVAAPVAAFGTLNQSYARIHQWIVDGLQTLGLAAALAPRVPPPGLGAGACFASPAGGEVIVAGRKLVGSAQLRQGSAFLQHGSLLLQDDQSRVTQLQRRPSTVGQETTLAQELGRSVEFEEVAESLASAFRAGGLHGQRDHPADLSARIASHQSRFQDPAWTWRR